MRALAVGCVSLAFLVAALKVSHVSDRLIARQAGAALLSAPTSPLARFWSYELAKRGGVLTGGAPIQPFAGLRHMLAARLAPAPRKPADDGDDEAPAKVPAATGPSREIAGAIVAYQRNEAHDAALLVVGPEGDLYRVGLSRPIMANLVPSHDLDQLLFRTATMVGGKLAAQPDPNGVTAVGEGDSFMIALSSGAPVQPEAKPEAKKPTKTEDDE
jgi:hypothetical protein